MGYDEKFEQAAWVEYTLTRTEVRAAHWPRNNNFRIDPSVNTGSAEPTDYAKSGYDKGHLCPAEDEAYDSTTESECFFMSNMSPQLPGFNRGVWKRLEAYVRNQVLRDSTIIVVTGPVFSSHDTCIGIHQVDIPKYFYKILIDTFTTPPHGIGFILPHASSSLSLQDFAVTIDSVEALTHLDILPNLTSEQTKEIEQSVDMHWWFDSAIKHDDK